MTRNLSRILILILVVATFALAGCKSRVKDQPEPEPVPTITEMEPTPPPVEVAPPTDFVTEAEPQVTAEDLSGTIDQVNERAQSLGWIRDVFFEFDSSALSADAQDSLAVTSSWLRSHPEYRLVIEGHTDERGTQQYNLALGERRANIAKDYLVTLGIDPVRIRTLSYGEERPFQTGSNESAWSQNRRAHMVLMRN